MLHFSKRYAFKIQILENIFDLFFLFLDKWVTPINFELLGGKKHHKCFLRSITEKNNLRKKLKLKDILSEKNLTMHPRLCKCNNI